MAAIESAYFWAIGRRLSFIVGVSSSPPGSQSPSTSVNRLMPSGLESAALAVSIPCWTAAITRPSRASALRSPSIPWRVAHAGA